MLKKVINYDNYHDKKFQNLFLHERREV